MEEARIKLNPFKEKNIFFYNKKRLIGKTDFRDYEVQPLLEWADDIFDRIGREIYDDFHLTVCGTSFEKAFLHDMKTSYALSGAEYDCIGFEEDLYDVNTDIEKRLKAIDGLAHKYNITIQQMEKLPVYCSEELAWMLKDKCDYIRSASIEEAFCIIGNDSLLSVQNFIKYPARLVLKTNNENIVVCNGKNSEGKKQYVWNISQNRNEAVLGYIVDYFCKIKRIKEIAQRIRENKSHFSEEDLRKFHACISVDSLYYVDEIPSLKINTSYIPVIKSYPDEGKKVSYHVELEDESIAVSKENMLLARTEGVTVAHFYTVVDDERILFDSKKIRVSGIYIDKIMIEPSKIELNVNDKKIIKIGIYPDDVSDIQIECICTDSSVATISAMDDGTFEIAAKKAGRCLFEFKAIKGDAKASCEVIVASTFKKMPVNSSNNYYKGIGAFAGALITGFLGMIFRIFEVPFLIMAGASAYFMLKALALRHLDEKQKQNALLVLVVVIVLAILIF